MKHTMTITWESRWTTDDMRPATEEDAAFVAENSQTLVRDLVDKDARAFAVSLDGVTLAEPEQGEDHD